MFQRHEKAASIPALEEWLDTINRKLAGIRWDDHEMRRMWKVDKRRVEKLIARKREEANADV